MPPERPIRVAIVDDHPIFRVGVKALIAAEPDMCVVGEAADGSKALAMIPSLDPDVLLIDLAMPHMTGFELLPQAAQLRPQMRIIVLTASIDPKDFASVLAQGAHGVLLKHLATDLLPRAIRRVMSGEFWLGREGVADLVRALRSGGEEVPLNRVLTRRELDIVRGVVRAESNKAIAAQLGISEQTVKNHLRHIFDKLGVTNRVELALKAPQLVDLREAGEQRREM